MPDGRVVEVEDEELEALDPQKSRDIDLRSFVPQQEIDPIYFERAYFLTPAGSSTKAYRLLAAAMERAGRAGIATFVMRGKEYLVAILAAGGILRAETLRFHDDIRSAADVGLAEPEKVAAKRVRRFAAAIAALEADELAPDELVDEHAAAIEALVARKRRQHRDVVEAPEAAEPEDERVDLMRVLQWSLRQTRDQGAGAERPRRGARSTPERRDRRRRAARSRRPAAELEGLTKQELYRRAQELEIPGRGAMTKEELVAALRSA